MTKSGWKLLSLGALATELYTFHEQAWCGDGSQEILEERHVEALVEASAGTITITKESRLRLLCHFGHFFK